MKHILIIALNDKSATGLCAKNIAYELEKNGYVVDFLTCGEKEHDLYDSGVDILHIKPKLWRQIIDYTKSRGNNVAYRLASLLYSVNIAISSIFIWPWNSPLFTRKLYRTVKKLYNKKNYDVIIPVYLEIDTLIVANIMKLKHPDIIYIPYFLDSLSGASVPRLLSREQKIKKGLRWERRLLNNADGIVAMKSSEEHHKQYSSSMPYYSKMFFLDIPMLLENDFCKKNETPDSTDSNCLVLTYLGSMPLSIRKPYYGIKLLQKIRNSGFEITLNIVGEIPPSNEYADFCKKREWVKIVGSVSHEDISTYIKKADVLINFGNNIKEMVPSKIFEYMSYGKPILSFSPNASDPSITYLQRYSNSCVINETDDVSENERKVTYFFDNFLKEIIPFDKTKKDFYLNTPECFVKFLDSLEEESKCV